MLIDELVRQFEACTLPLESWTHAAHLSVALWYLRQHPRGETARRIRSGIQRYNAANDKRLATHETITLAWIVVITIFLTEQPRETPFAELQRELLERCGDKDYLLRFYSRERLFSETARREWLPPDRTPVDNRATKSAGTR
jgi:hypothetical protein